MLLGTEKECTTETPPARMDRQTRTRIAGSVHRFETSRPASKVAQVAMAVGGWGARGPHGAMPGSAHLSKLSKCSGWVRIALWVILPKAKQKAKANMTSACDRHARAKGTCLGLTVTFPGGADGLAGGGNGRTPSGAQPCTVLPLPLPTLVLVKCWGERREGAGGAPEAGPRGWATFLPRKPNYCQLISLEPLEPSRQPVRAAKGQTRGRGRLRGRRLGGRWTRGAGPPADGRGRGSPCLSLPGAEPGS